MQPIKDEKFSTVAITVPEYTILYKYLNYEVLDEDGDSVDDFTISDELNRAVNHIATFYGCMYLRNSYEPKLSIQEASVAVKRMIRVIEDLFDDTWDMSTIPAKYNLGQTYDDMCFTDSINLGYWDNTRCRAIGLPAISPGWGTIGDSFKRGWGEDEAVTTMDIVAEAHKISADVMEETMTLARYSLGYGLHLCLSLMGIPLGITGGSSSIRYASQNIREYAKTISGYDIDSFLRDPSNLVRQFLPYTQNLYRSRKTLGLSSCFVDNKVVPETFVSKLASTLIMWTIISGKLSSPFISLVETLKFDDAVNSIIAIHNEVLGSDPLIVNYIKDWAIPEDYTFYEEDEDEDEDVEEGAW